MNENKELKDIEKIHEEVNKQRVNLLDVGFVKDDEALEKHKKSANLTVFLLSSNRFMMYLDDQWVPVDGSSAYEQIEEVPLVCDECSNLNFFSRDDFICIHCRKAANAA